MGFSPGLKPPSHCTARTTINVAFVFEKLQCNHRCDKEVDENVADIVKNRRLKGVKRDVIVTPWRPTPPASLPPFLCEAGQEH